MESEKLTNSKKLHCQERLRFEFFAALDNRGGAINSSFARVLGSTPTASGWLKKGAETKLCEPTREHSDGQRLVEAVAEMELCERIRKHSSSKRLVEQGAELEPRKARRIRFAPGDAVSSNVILPSVLEENGAVRVKDARGEQEADKCKKIVLCTRQESLRFEGFAALENKG
jgi:hypothetical protein